MQLLQAWLLLLVLCGRASLAAPAQTSIGLLVGIGKADVTGPVADVNLMGYANLLQTAGGLQMRLYARAYIFASSEEPSKRAVFVNVDACMASQLVTQYVIDKLQAEFGPDLYRRDNVAISGTHTHASTAGFLQYILYSITSLGFVRQSFDALVEGIAESIRRAHADIAPGKVLVNAGDLTNASINRSPSAYLANPAEERAMYTHNTESTVTLLKVVSEDQPARDRGLLSWFAVHCTSLNNTNRLVSGDNKGVAEQLAEVWGASKTEPGFVAAFAQGAVGDTSPNVQGPFCIDTGEPCDNPTSTCNGRNEMCHGRGPYWPDDQASSAEIGRRQWDKARELYESAQEEVVGPVDSRHVFLNMSSITVPPGPWWSSGPGTTCPPAMGWSFAAGTTDGPGQFDFTQGDTKGTNPFWRLVRNALLKPTKQQEACQAPKPILLDTGSAHVPYEWQPSVTEVSLLRIGQFVIACLPGEPTTMAGRRIIRALQEVLRPAWGDNVRVTIAGLVNTYSSYVTTAEEYDIQRYEGASTLYGRHTLSAYIQALVGLAEDMVAGRPTTPSGATPPNLYDRQISFLPPVVLDAVPPGSHFGGVVQDVPEGASFTVNDTVQVKFRSACPRNSLRTGGTFLLVERWEEEASAPASSTAATTVDTSGAQSGGGDGSSGSDGGQWVGVANDNDLSTQFLWGRPFKVSPESFATVRWTIPPGTPPGTYRLTHLGDRKLLTGGTQEFNGSSRSFQVTLAPDEHHISHFVIQDQTQVESHGSSADDSDDSTGLVRQGGGSGSAEQPQRQQPSQTALLSRLADVLSALLGSIMGVLRGYGLNLPQLLH